MSTHVFWASAVTKLIFLCMCLFQDRALPLAIKTGNKKAELRLCNKLVQLLVNLQDSEDSLEYAQVSVTLSVKLGKANIHRLLTVRLLLSLTEF